MPRRTSAHSLLGGLLLLTARLAWASSPPPPEPETNESPQVQGELFVWSGGATRAEAEAQKKHFAAYQRVLESVLTLEPQVLESARIEGLKPGFFVVALGVCPKAETTLLKVFQALAPEVYTRTVKYAPTHDLPALDCPQMAEATSNDDGEPVRWKIERTERVVQGKSTLIALTFSYYWSQQGDFGSSYFNVKALYFGVDKKRRLLDSKTYSGPTDASELESLKIEEEQLVAEVKYGDPRCEPSSDYFKGWRRRVRAALDKGKIKLTEGEPHLREEGPCGYADEARLLRGESP
ncbi:hypothetical protein [Archangium primigenium]|uniref:hypothetical protein n=1 Tax=[Archangium] primigenium TaxID=2792470 RepID=UPI001957D3C3|nr:hypothetical protein [Archangium primigenium]MBM7114432.1 hypothetical protein [Archangium primigenium]